MYLQYGLSESGELISIDRVAAGAECKCFCPACHEALIARKGAIRIHHFAHKKMECRYAAQTVLHLLAKAIVEEYKKICLPSLFVHSGNEKGPNIELIRSQLVECENVTLERKLNKIIPDVLFSVQGVAYCLEVKVSHGVDADKKEKLKEMSLACIELDLSKVDRQPSLNDLVQWIVYETNLKSWIYHPYAYEVLQKIAKMYSLRKRRGIAIQNCPRFRGLSVSIEDCLCCEFHYMNPDKQQFEDVIGCVANYTNAIVEACSS